MNSAYIIDGDKHKHIKRADVRVSEGGYCVYGEDINYYGLPSRSSWHSNNHKMQITSNGKIIYDNTPGGKDEVF